MTIKAHFNPSTGKVAFNPDTGKVQVIDVAPPPILCEDCEPLPDSLTLTISGLATCCLEGSTPAKSVRFPESVVDLLNGTHILPRLGVTCVYQIKFLDFLDNVLEYDESDDCTGTGTIDPPSTIIFEPSIFVRFQDPPNDSNYLIGITMGFQLVTSFRIQIWEEAAELPCWDQTFNDPFIGVCGDPGLIVGAWIAGGTVVMEETP
jgi:hypothetical protein